MPCFSCKCFREGRGRNGKRLSGGRGWCELWDEEYYRGHECRKFAPKWINPGANKKNRSAMKEPTGCFQTSACVQHKGLPDDCAELTKLRQFRDTFLKATSEGRKLVDKYYRIAPSIVEWIDQSADKDSIYNDIYETIQSCLALIREREYDKAVAQYRDMVYGLQNNMLTASTDKSDKAFGIASANANPDLFELEQDAFAMGMMDKQTVN